MANDLAKPMQAMLTRAARTLPATTGETARYSRLQHTDGPTLILCDVSYSMASPAWSSSEASGIHFPCARACRDLAGT